MSAISIRPEVRAMTLRDESEVARSAVLRHPDVAPLRLRLARLCNQLDAFDETIALLTAPEAGALGHDAWLVLAAACFARGDAPDAECAAAAARHASALARTDADRASALGEQAKALLRSGDTAAACAMLEQALALDPHNRSACKRLATEQLRRGDPHAVLALTDRLAARGVGHTRLLTMRMLALAMAGRTADARATIAPERFLYRQPLAAPAGWPDLARFNAALAEELSAHPGLRYGRYGTASERSWRIEAPAAGPAPATRALLARIVEAAEAHLDALAGPAHPWLSSAPAQATLRSWCVLTEGDGFENWHAHPLGWMSGGYYVQVPQAVEEGDDAAGCLAFGLPGGLIGDDAARAFGEVLVRPRAGLLTLFPSHAYHRTFPHRATGRRICVAFDIQPG